MPMGIRRLGGWSDVVSPSIRVGGAWVDIQAGWVMKGGVWTQFYTREVLPPAPYLYLVSDISYCDLGDPVYAVHLEWVNGDASKQTRIYGRTGTVDVAAGETSYDLPLSSGGGDQEFYVVHFNTDTGHEGAPSDPFPIFLPDPC